MPYCPSCGAEVEAGMRFCPGCGAALSAQPAAQIPAAPEPIDFSAPVEPRDYSLILISQGTATKTLTRELLEDIFGYTVTDARKLTTNMPIEAARHMTADQAAYAAQAFTEYGVEVAVMNSGGYVDLGYRATSSVYTAVGGFAAGAAAAFAALTVANRVSTFRPWLRRDVYRHVFRPVFFRPAPPPPRRRSPRPAPPPPRRAAPPPPPAPRRAPAPRPAPAKRAPAPKPPAPKMPSRATGRSAAPGRGPGKGPGRGPGPGGRR